MTQHVMDYLRQCGSQTLLLTATNQGRPVYEKLGFRVQTENHFYTGSGVEGEALPAEVIPMTRADVSACVELDRVVTGEDRRQLISDAFQSGWMVRDPATNQLLGMCVNTPIGSPAIG